MTLSFPSGRTAEEVVVDDAAGLAWIVNLGCIELHPHPVRSGDLDHPDELRVDLDPGPGVAWDDVRTVALEVKALLEELGLRGWPKTSGSRGMHVNVRIEPRWTFHRGAARGARAVARDRAARAGARDLEVVEGGAPRRLPRLQPERQGPHHLLGLFGAPAARRARLDAARTGTKCPTASRPTSPSSRCRSASPRSAIRTPTWTTPPGSLEKLLELAARTKPRASATRRGRRTSARWRAKRRASRRRARRRREEATREDAADRRRQLAGQGRGAGRPRALEERNTRRRPRTSPSTTCWSIPCAAALDLDAHPRQPAPCARSDAPAAGDPRPRRRSDARMARSAS